jgi:hypothetical protein
MTRIGVIGHRDISEDCTPLIETALRRLLVAQGGSRLVGVTCLAPGADQLFARTVLDLSGRLEVILPAADYRDTMVAPDNAPLFDRLLAAASSVRVMKLERSCQQAYLAAGAAMLAGVETLVAIWDGRPARRRGGGTSAVVVAAARLGLPTSIIWPAGSSRGRPLPSAAPASVLDSGPLPVVATDPAPAHRAPVLDPAAVPYRVPDLVFG